MLTTCAFDDLKGGELDDISQLTPSCFHFGVIIWSMQVLQFLGYLVAESKNLLTLGPSSGLKSEPQLGDDEAVIHPTIGIADRFGYQHVLSISPPDENIVKQLRVPRPRVHPRGLVLRRKAEEDVGQQETVFGTHSQKKVAFMVTAIETMGTQRSLPGSVVYHKLGIEVTSRLRHSHQYGMQILVKFVLCRIIARHWVSVGADDGGELVSPKRQAEAHQAIIDTLRQTGQTSHDVVLDGKGNISIASLSL
ncbi:unnamed protein product [Schistocephalus solidus]|uniref:Uncharacterized protein n=1 Tax=Schistocephalus solidus TaxID=70667 RepID=A0A183SNF7_SCHSO|nr:unnamed protein product [Schistocephalus solidus]